MVFNNFDKKANELLVEFLPAAAPVVVAAPQLGAMATGLIGGLIAVLGTAGAIHSGLSKVDKSQPASTTTPVDLGGGVTIGKEPEAKKTQPVDLGGGVTIGTPEAQPTPTEQQPMTLPNIERGKPGYAVPSRIPVSTPETQPTPAEQQPMTLPNIERGKPGYAVPSRIPAFRPTQPDIRPETKQQTNTQTPLAVPVPIPPAPASQPTQPNVPQPPKEPLPAGQQTDSSIVVPPVPPLPSFESEPTKRASIEAYPIDRQLGDINVPGTKTAYRNTFNMPAMQAFETGLNQPKLQQNVPQGDIPNAPTSLRAKYKHRAENPGEYEGTKAFGGISNLFK
ncbi:MAG: hypothetical protein EBX50_19830 [Chitinophagia bacterium]|nr:hypothetical protein [Chitinophagia bacterium]